MELQKAFLWKRVAAGLLDFILAAVLSVGFAFLLSALLGYDGYSTTLDNAYERYEQEYGVTFDISQEEYEELSPEEKEIYDAAYNAFVNDEAAMHAYNMMLHLSVVITAIGILLGVIPVEFIVPLLFGNGQTLGKKIFGICLVRNDCVKVTVLQLFVRTLLGKYTIEIMVPVFIIFMVFWGTIGIVGPAVLIGLVIAEIVFMITSRTNSPIHDLLAGTVAADMTSQRIFENEEQLIEYKKKLHAEQTAKQTY